MPAPNPIINTSTPSGGGGGLSSSQTTILNSLTAPIDYDDGNQLAAVSLPSSIGSDVKIALNVDDGTITDASTGGRSATLVGDAHISTDRAFVGLSSIELDGTGDYVTFPQSTDDDFGSGDFMVEAAVYPEFTLPVATDTHIISKWGIPSSATASWSLYFKNVAGVQRIAWAAVESASPSTYVSHVFTNYTVPSNNRWYHIRVARVGNVLYLFVDGRLKDSISYATNLYTVTNRVLEIGGVNSGAGVWDGYIDAVRTQKGGTVSADEFDVLRHPFGATKVVYQPEKDPHAPVEITADQTLSVLKGEILYRVTGAHTLTLPAMSTWETERGVYIPHIINDSASNVTISLDGADEVNGSNSDIVIAARYGHVKLRWLPGTTKAFAEGDFWRP